tara:strand:+ start:439 stop:687 length:249 start_codon:yes stop_codon:yes gene_type:complete
VELEKQFRLHIQDHLYPQSVVAVVVETLVIQEEQVVLVVVQLVVDQDLQDLQLQLTLVVEAALVVQVDQDQQVVLADQELSL